MDKRTDISIYDYSGRPWESELGAYCQEILRGIGWYHSSTATASQPDIGSVVFTGVSPGQGVTTLAVSTAVIAARDLTTRVCLLDCSEARDVHQYFDFADTVAGLDSRLAKHIRTTTHGNLDILSLSDAREIRNSQRMKLAIRRLFRCFDLVVIDMPARYRSRWRSVLLAESDLSLIVADQDCPQMLLENLANDLGKERARNVGVIVNRD